MNCSRSNLKPTRCDGQETFGNVQAADRPLNQTVSTFAAAQKAYGWGPSGDVKSGRFFTGNAWGPTSS